MTADPSPSLTDAEPGVRVERDEMPTINLIAIEHRWTPLGDGRVHVSGEQSKADVANLIARCRELGAEANRLQIETEKLQTALQRGWSWSQYQYADAHDCWASHAGDGTADGHFTTPTQETP